MNHYFVIFWRWSKNLVIILILVSSAPDPDAQDAKIPEEDLPR